MKYLGITGQNGFLGYHLLNWGKISTEFTIIPFQRSYFKDAEQMKAFVEKCDVIIHAAAIIKHPNDTYLVKENLKLLESILSACEVSIHKPNLVLTSSIQEGNGTPYGNMKRAVTNRALTRGEEVGTAITILRLPNLFGPFAKPHFNSVVATFCAQLAEGHNPVIKEDNTIPLLYVEDAVKKIFDVILNPTAPTIPDIKWDTSQVLVSALLKTLNQFHHMYSRKGEIPEFSSDFKKQLFLTYQTYLSPDYFPRFLNPHRDQRGWFMEVVRSFGGGQVSVSVTSENTSRGHHFHTRKIERFAIVKGKAKLSWRRIGTKSVQTFLLDSNNPSYIDIPIWHTHAISNIGAGDLIMLFWVNEHYDEMATDTYQEMV